MSRVGHIYLELEEIAGSLHLALDGESGPKRFGHSDPPGAVGSMSPHLLTPVTDRERLTLIYNRMYPRDASRFVV